MTDDNGAVDECSVSLSNSSRVQVPGSVQQYRCSCASSFLFLCRQTGTDSTRSVFRLPTCPVVANSLSIYAINQQLHKFRKKYALSVCVVTVAADLERSGLVSVWSAG